VCDDAVEKLTAAMAAGDENAVETFYREYFDWLYATARAATRRDESFCLDVVQDAVLRIIRTVRRVPHERQLRAWLRLVVQTTAFDHLRREKRRLRHEKDSRPLFEKRGRESFSDCDAQLAWIKQQIEKLDPKIVQIIDWRFEQRWTLARIASRLGVSIGTVDGRLRRALKEIRTAALEEFDV
jgi:RNA polymerase sigma factor (sigma-70 family)